MPSLNSSLIVWVGPLQVAESIPPQLAFPGFIVGRIMYPGLGHEHMLEAFTLSSCPAPHEPTFQVFPSQVTLAEAPKTDNAAPRVLAEAGSVHVKPTGSPLPESETEV